MRPHKFSKASTDLGRASSLSCPWRTERKLHAVRLSRGLATPLTEVLSFPGPMRQAAIKHLSSAPQKRHFSQLAKGACLGLAITVARFGFCTFFQICVILPFCSEGQTWTCCMLSEVEIHDLNLWFLIQSILDLMGFETSAGLAYCAIGQFLQVN